MGHHSTSRLSEQQRSPHLQEYSAHNQTLLYYNQADTASKNKERTHFRCLTQPAQNLAFSKKVEADSKNMCTPESLYVPSHENIITLRSAQSCY